MSLKKLANSQAILNEVVIEHNESIRQNKVDIKKNTKKVDNAAKTIKHVMREVETVKMENRNLQMKLDKSNGESYSDIAAKHNLSKSRVGQILKDN